MTGPDLIVLLLALGCGVALGIIGVATMSFARLEAQDDAEPTECGPIEVGGIDRRPLGVWKNTTPWDQGKSWDQGK